MDLINKAAGGWIREAGKQPRKKLYDFTKHAPSLPCTFLRYAIEHLIKNKRNIIWT